MTIYSLSASNEVDLLTSWSGAFIALTLSVVPSSLRSGNADEILVGDAIRSMILLQFKYKPGSPKLPTLQEVARDYRGKYLTAAEWVDYPTPSNVGSAARGQEVEDEEMGEATDLANAGADSGDKGKTTSSAAAKSGEEFIGAEIDLNLFTVRKEDVTTNRSMEDEYTLSPRGEFHLGEMVSKFVRGSSIVFSRLYRAKERRENRNSCTAVRFDSFVHYAKIDLCHFGRIDRSNLETRYSKQ